jgi:hypothetical protein
MNDSMLTVGSASRLVQGNFGFGAVLVPRMWITVGGRGDRTAVRRLRLAGIAPRGQVEERARPQNNNVPM